MVNSCQLFEGKRVEIILDNQYVSFKKCIKIIETLKDKSITFKILPKKANFLISPQAKNLMNLEFVRECRINLSVFHYKTCDCPSFSQILL